MKQYIPGVSMIAYMSNLVKLHGGINLAQGVPGFDPPEKLVTLLKETINKPLHQYAPGDGNPRLMDAVIGLYKNEISLSRKNILITQGATEAITLVYTWINKKFGPDIAVMAMDPLYESFTQLPDIFNHQLITASFNKRGEINWDETEQKLQQSPVRLFFLNSPGNPWGRVWSREEVKKLITLAEQHDFYILSDSVYSDLYFNNEPPYVPVQDIHRRVFVVNSFSKMLSITGWRIGFLIADPEPCEEIKRIHDYTGLCANSFIQEAVAAYLLENDNGRIYRKHLRKQMKKSCDFLSKSLNEIGFGFVPPEAGYFIWANLPQPLTDGFHFAIDLYESEKVAVVPGIHFSPNATEIVRFNFARPLEELKVASERIKNYVMHQ